MSQQGGSTPETKAGHGCPGSPQGALVEFILCMKMQLSVDIFHLMYIYFFFLWKMYRLFQHSCTAFVCIAGPQITTFYACYKK